MVEWCKSAKNEAVYLDTSGTDSCYRWVKETKLGVFFPVLIGVLAPVRIVLEKCKIFTKSELDLLDGEIA